MALQDRSASSRKRARGGSPESDDEQVDPTEEVSLRAGGRVFTAQRDTWTMFPDSMVATLVGLHKGPGVASYIEADPDAFGRCVNYLRRRGSANFVPPESDEALDSFAACADMLNLGRLHALLRLEQRRRAWERELECLERDLARTVAMRDAIPKAFGSEMSTRIVDIGPDAKHAAKAARPLMYGGHPSLAAANAHECEQLDREMQDLVHDGYNVKAITPLMSGPYSEAWTADDANDFDADKTNLTTLVLLTLEKPSRDHLMIGSNARLVVTRCLKELDLLYHRWLLQQLPKRMRERSAFVPTSACSHETALNPYEPDFVLLRTHLASMYTRIFPQIEPLDFYNLIIRILADPVMVVLGHANDNLKECLSLDDEGLAEELEDDIFLNSLQDQVAALRRTFRKEHRAQKELLEAAGHEAESDDDSS